MAGLASATGGSDDGGERGGREAFISGNFEYGFGRAASRRKVYLFANRAQVQSALADATVQFLGVYRTDRRVRARGAPPIAAAGWPDQALSAAC